MAKFFYDFHIHTCLSPCGDNDMVPDKVLGMALMNGLNVIAITDHNSARNCSAFMERGEEFGIQVIPGMELNTAEEVHIIFLFKTLANAIEFDAYVYSRLKKIKNNEKIFGSQFLVNGQGKILGSEENLLINATDISLDEIPMLSEAFEAVFFPAHIDKDSFSLIRQIGSIPENSRFSAFEIFDIHNLKKIRNRFPYLKSCQTLFNSDAHFLNQINEATHFLELEKGSINEIFRCLQIKK